MGTQLPLPKKGAEPPIFGPYLCGQMAAWIKMPLGMDVGLDPGDFVLDGDPAPSPERGRSPQIFGPCLLWQLTGWIKMALGMEVGLGSGHVVLHGDPAREKGGHSPPIFAHI